MIVFVAFAIKAMFSSAYIKDDDRKALALNVESSLSFAGCCELQLQLAIQNASVKLGNYGHCLFLG